MFLGDTSPTFGTCLKDRDLSPIPETLLEMSLFVGDFQLRSPEDFHCLPHKRCRLLHIKQKNLKLKCIGNLENKHTVKEKTGADVGQKPMQADKTTSIFHLAICSSMQNSKDIHISYVLVVLLISLCRLCSIHNGGEFY